LLFVNQKWLHIVISIINMISTLLKHYLALLTIIRNLALTLLRYNNVRCYMIISNMGVRSIAQILHKGSKVWWVEISWLVLKDQAWPNPLTEVHLYVLRNRLIAQCHPILMTESHNMTWSQLILLEIHVFRIFIQIVVVYDYFAFGKIGWWLLDWYL